MDTSVSGSEFLWMVIQFIPERKQWEEHAIFEREEDARKIANGLPMFSGWSTGAVIPVEPENETYFATIEEYERSKVRSKLIEEPHAQKK